MAPIVRTVLGDVEASRLLRPLAPTTSVNEVKLAARMG